MTKKMGHKAKPAFVVSLVFVSILGFLSIAFESFGLLSINAYVTSMIFMVLGIGLIIEGNFRFIIKMLKGGLTNDEISHILAVVVGITSVLSGFMTLPFIDIASEIFNSFKGLLAVFAIVIIFIEGFLVE